MSDANTYQRNLGEKLANALGNGFKFYKTNMELRRASPNGHDVIILGGSNKYSPYISVSFYFGKRFDSVRKIEKLKREEPMPYHIWHYAPNSRSMDGLGHEGANSWEIDIRNELGDITSEVVHGIQGIAYPFFNRFSELSAAREALASANT